jgi:hypothetical protein
MDSLKNFFIQLDLQKKGIGRKMATLVSTFSRRKGWPVAAVTLRGSSHGLDRAHDMITRCAGEPLTWYYYGGSTASRLILSVRVGPGRGESWAT